MAIETDVGKRWEAGTPHRPEVSALYKRIDTLDFANGDVFYFKSGGDGDNGEHLMYLLDIIFEQDELRRELDALEK